MLKLQNENLMVFPFEYVWSAPLPANYQVFSYNFREVKNCCFKAIAPIHISCMYQLVIRLTFAEIPGLPELGYFTAGA